MIAIELPTIVDAVTFMELDIEAGTVTTSSHLDLKIGYVKLNETYRLQRHLWQWIGAMYVGPPIKRMPFCSQNSGHTPTSNTKIAHLAGTSRPCHDDLAANNTWPTEMVI